MAKKKEEEVDFSSLKSLNSEYVPFSKKDAEQIVVKSPVINGFFYNESEDEKGKEIITWGIPKRSVIEFVAESGVGKSTLALQMCRELLELGYNVAYIDTEKGVNMNILRNMGMEKYYQNENKRKGGYFVIYNETDCDRVNSLVQELADKNIFQTIVVDSIGAMDSGLYKLGAGSVDNQKVGGDSKAVKAVLKTINTLSMKHNLTFILINHLMKEIGTYIPKETILGGRAAEYLVDVIVELRKKGALYKNDKNDKIPIGQKVEYEIKKSRFGRGKCPTSFYLMYGAGIAMIPTIREVIEQIEVDYKGKKIKMLDIRGGGNGSLFLNDQEYKFRGELQLYNLIGKHYMELIGYVTPKLFSAKIPDSRSSNDWYSQEKLNFSGKLSSVNINDIDVVDEEDDDEVSMVNGDVIDEDLENLEPITYNEDDFNDGE